MYLYCNCRKHKYEMWNIVLGFEEGSITIKGYLSDIRGFTSNMSTEDGGIMISFCCRNDNHSNLPTFTQTHPFVLIKVN